MTPALSRLRSLALLAGLLLGLAGCEPRSDPPRPKAPLTPAVAHAVSHPPAAPG